MGKPPTLSFPGFPAKLSLSESSGDGREWVCLGYPLGGRRGWSFAKSPSALWPFPGLNIPSSREPGMPGSGSPGSHHLVSLFLPVRQYADICLFNTAQYKCPVAMEEAE